MPKVSHEERLDGLKQQLITLQANANAVQGAIQLLEQLIKEDSDLTAPKPTED